MPCPRIARDMLVISLLLLHVTGVRSEPEESTLHGLRDCPRSKEFWLRMGFGSNTILTCQNIQAWILAVINHRPSALILSTVWCLWKWRNNSIFTTEQWGVPYVCNLTRLTTTELELYCSKLPRVTMHILAQISFCKAKCIWILIA
ncbi:hypothetical protein AAZV13_01G180850 [Glycine max]